MRRLQGYTYTGMDLQTVVGLLREIADNLEKGVTFLDESQLAISHDTNAYEIVDIRLEPVRVVEHRELTLRYQRRVH